MTQIDSVSNPRIKALVRLRERRHRDQSSTFLIEGYRELTRAVDAGVDLETLFVCESLFIGGNEAGLLERVLNAGSEIVTVSEPAFRRSSYRDRPEGLLAVARQFHTEIERIALTGSPLILVVEAIEKPGNLGTMLRTADAADVSGVIVCDPTTDPYNPNVVRASLGTLFTVPLAITSTATAVSTLRAAGVTTVATTPDADALLWDIDLRGPLALVIGSEQYGLSQDWLATSTHRARLPMAGSADSLNAAMAAGISLFEAVRQRGSTSI